MNSPTPPLHVQKGSVRHVGCAEMMASMGDDAMDHIITSPPYNMNLRIRNGEYCSRQIVKEFSSKYEGFDDNLPIEDFYNLHLSLLREMLRVTKGYIFYNIAIVTGSKRAFFKIMGALSDELKEVIIWDKGHGQPAMQEGVLNRQSELLLVFSKDDAMSRTFKTAQFERGCLSDTWDIARAASESKDHAATFPQEMVARILRNFTSEGEIIYDPFSGTGTTGVVCFKEKRRFVGSEISAAYCQLANDRINGLLL